MTRRAAFVGTAAAVGSFGLSACGLGGASDDGENFDTVASAASPLEDSIEAGVVVVGSGFGGAVAAYRLCAAGIPVTLVERGRRWDLCGKAKEPFSPVFPPDGRTTWLAHTTAFPPGMPFPIRKYLGIIEKVTQPTVRFYLGAGYGGGSLAYGGILAAPTAENFARAYGTTVPFAEMEQVYFPRALRRLRASVVPDDILGHEAYTYARVFAAQARKAGLVPHRLPLAIDWETVRRELRGEIPPSITTGYVSYGNNSGAKFSVDRTYLAEAETTGRLSTLLQHRVVRFAQERQGRFVLELEQLDLRGRVVARRTLRCRALVLAAGFYGTTSLLLKAQTEGTVPGLPESLGEGVGDNGLVMFVRRGFGDDTGKAQAGPPVFSAQGPAHVRGANTSGLDSGLDSALAPAPCSVEVAPLPYVSFGHALLQAVITHHGARGVLRHDERTGQTRFDYDEANLDVPRRTGASMAQLFNDAAGGQLSTMPPFRGMLQGEVAHGTGGCVLGQTCDAFGRVMGVPGLYVVDGALLPGTGAGANPALTITALAERCFDRIVNEDGKFLGATT